MGRARPLGSLSGKLTKEPKRTYTMQKPEIILKGGKPLFGGIPEHVEIPAAAISVPSSKMFGWNLCNHPLSRVHLTGLSFNVILVEKMS
jgi:hypothetical protein